MKILIFLFLLKNVHQSLSYKPVILMHGIMTGSESMELIKLRIQEKHPGTNVYNINQFEGWSSLESMWYQVKNVGNYVMNISRNHSDGVHFIGYSQGALLSRTILQAFPEHNVHNFISLSGPQAGQYGTKFLDLIFSNLALDSAYELFYSRIGQHTSVGNYWNDPYHQALFYKYSQYLPYVNNDIKTNKTDQFKVGLTKLKNFVLIGGPDDGVITPWQSSQFGYYNNNDTVVTVVDRPIYKEDLIGLKTLHDQGKLQMITVPGVNHFMWHTDLPVIDNYILPYLD